MHVNRPRCFDVTGILFSAVSLILGVGVVPLLAVRTAGCFALRT